MPTLKSHVIHKLLRRCCFFGRKCLPTPLFAIFLPARRVSFACGTPRRLAHGDHRAQLPTRFGYRTAYLSLPRSSSGHTTGSMLRLRLISLRDGQDRRRKWTEEMERVGREKESSTSVLVSRELVYAAARRSGAAARYSRKATLCLARYPRKRKRTIGPWITDSSWL
jgi:hypothetical protein